MFVQDVVAAVKSGKSQVILIDHDGEVIIVHEEKEIFFKMQNLQMMQRKILNDAFNGDLIIED